MDDDKFIPYELYMPICQAIKEDDTTRLMNLTVEMKSLHKVLPTIQTNLLPNCFKKHPYMLHIAAYYGSVNCFRTVIHFAAYSASSEIYNLLEDLDVPLDSDTIHRVKPMHIAAKYGNYDMCCWLWINGQEIDTKTYSSNSPLTLALLYKHYTIASFLIKAGADVNQPFKQFTVFTYVVQNSIEEAYSAIDEKVSIRIPDSRGYFPLHCAARIGDLDKCQRLMLPPSEGQQYFFGNKMTPLHLAIESENIDVLKLFIDNGYDVRNTNEKGDTLFHIVARTNSLETASILHSIGIQHEANYNNCTPLIIAINHGNYEMVKLFLEQGADPNAGNNEKGAKPLHIAIQKGFTNIVEILIEYEADLNATDSIGRIAMHYAALKGNIKMVQMLWDAGSVINVPDNNDDYPLNLAIMKNNKKCIELLNEFEAFGLDDIEYRDYEYVEKKPKLSKSEYYS